jgi:hypothetical protein
LNLGGAASIEGEAVAEEVSASEREADPRARDRWTNQKAMADAKSHGLHWVEIGMKRYIQGYRGTAASQDISEVAAETSR